MSKIILSAAIAAAFVQNSKEDTLLVTPDGNCFLEKDKSFADLHARSTNQKVQIEHRKDYEAEIAELTPKAEATTEGETEEGKGKKGKK